MFRTAGIAILFLFPYSNGLRADDKTDLEKLEKQRCPKPTEFAIVFSFGYSSDLMPKEDDRFEALLKKIKDGGFNTIHCTYTEKRVELCKKHGIKMMVDLLVEEMHHVYKSPDKAKSICEKLRDSESIWGYNIWNDPVRKTGEGRRRDVNNVRQWDPTHPAYSGTYRTEGMSHLANADLIGYYDFHWKRGREQHFPHLLAFSNWARERDAWFYSWLAASSGIPGKGNFNRSLWSANTAIACGQKGILWFLATDMMDQKTFEWTETGRDIAKVNQEILPLKNELARIGNPIAIWSTAITRTANNDPLPDGKKDVFPAGLEKKAFTKDALLTPVHGEYMVGEFLAGKLRFFFLANHNAYAEQAAKWKLNSGLKLERFDRTTGKWLPLDGNDGAFGVTLHPGGGELLRLVDTK